MGYVSESTPSLLTPHLTKINSGISLLKPLSRRGTGPGIIVLVHEVGNSPYDTTTIKEGVPSPAMKWAEEGYTVAEVREGALTAGPVGSQDPLGIAINALKECDSCEPNSKIGIVAYSPSLWNRIAHALESHQEIAGSALYADAADIPTLLPSDVPSVQHFAGQLPKDTKLERTKQLTQHSYPSMASFAFASPSSPDFDYATEAVSHTRNLTGLKKAMDGPWFDLEAIWDEHTYFEFEVRDVPKTMSTMVEEPYVNHIPTITGGIGRAPLTDFYQNNFVFNNPEDTELELISRTVGIDRVVDEFVFKFTHDKMIDWLLPGVPPTYRRAEIPFTAVVNVRGDRLYHEHISWDQATCLRQLGLLPEYLPWPAELSIHGVKGANTDGKRYEYQLPVAGNETAKKMRDKNSVESNQMFAFKVREASQKTNGVHQ